MAAGLIGLTSASLMFFCPELLVHLFISDATPELVAMAVPAIRTYAAAILINWIYFCTQEFVIALKLTRISSVLSVFATFIYPTTAIVLLAHSDSTYFGGLPVIGAALTVLTSIVILIHIRTTHFAGIPVRHSRETR